MNTDDLISLHPGDEESLSLPDVTLGGYIRASQDFSDGSAVDLDDLGRSDVEEMLNKLADAYDEAFPNQPTATSTSDSNSNDVPDASTSGYSPDESSSSEAPNSSSTEPQPGTT